MCQTTPMRWSPGFAALHRLGQVDALSIPATLALLLPASARMVSSSAIIDRVELVIAGDLLERGRAAFLLKDDEVADEIQEAAFLEHALAAALPAG